MGHWYQRELGPVVAAAVCLLVGYLGRQQKGFQAYARNLAVSLFGLLSAYAWRDKLGLSSNQIAMLWLVVIAVFIILFPWVRKLGDKHGSVG
jgi:hypothetical protein